MQTTTCKFLIISILLSAVLVFSACPAGTPTTNVTTNNTNNGLVNTNAVNSNTNVTVPVGSTVETKEPEKYQAVVTLKMATSGDQKLTIPEMKANVARDGQNRRMEFNLPNGDKVVYLDVNGKQLMVLPNRKQYAELNKESLGFEIRTLMMPDQIVAQAKNQKGVQLVGEENYNGRPAVKYQYGATTDTKTTAGQVETKSYLFVDKETSLPLHTETTSESLTGSYRGITGLRVITDITDIKTTVEPALFAEPTDFQKIEAEQVKAQVNTIFQVAMTVLGQLMKSAQTPPASPMTSPTANTAR